jgi:hypothetical protein
MPVQYEPSNNSHTWFSTRTAEFRRLLEGQTTGTITNAQRLAHPWKIRKQEQNRQHKQHIDGILDAQLAYINNPDATHTHPYIPHTMCYSTAQWRDQLTNRPDTSVKPTLYLCMNNILPAQEPLHITAPRTPPDQPIKRKVSWKPTFHTIPGTPDSPSPHKTTTKKQRISQTYLRMLLQAKRRKKPCRPTNPAEKGNTKSTQPQPTLDANTLTPPGPTPAAPRIKPQIATVFLTFISGPKQIIAPKWGSLMQSQSYAKRKLKRMRNE